MNNPKISIITPSLNQAPFLERTIRSVLDQAYDNVEYIVIDGGSTDGSVDIIRRYQHRIAHWQSEPDCGQANAINKGLRLATGEWIAWQNSDDVYFPGAFQGLARAARRNPDAALLIGDIALIDEGDRVLRDVRYVRPTYRSLLAEGMVLTNQAAFWRRHAHQDLGFLDESFVCGFDYDWFLRLTQRYPAAHAGEIWGGLRLHGRTKSSRIPEVFAEEYRHIRTGREAGRLARHAYELRRLILMLAGGQFGYVTRGIYRRIRGIPDVSVE
jgi:glycosyltransferase involved in cell wall biosynthesis